MSLIELSNFTSEIPRLPQHGLPNNAAHTSLDCDFAYGELRGIQGPLTLKTVASSVKAIYTEDGAKYYFWDQPTEVCKSQRTGDVKKRICYTYGNGADTRFVSMVDEPPTVTGTSVSRGLDIATFDYATLTTADWRTPAQLTTLYNTAKHFG